MSDAEALKVLETEIRAAIQAAGGVLSFRRFMDLALYAPGLGYYERRSTRIGRAGDFMTSVSTGPLFGELLAAQIAEWSRARCLQDSTVSLVESGAHTGRLAADILEALCRDAPDVFERVIYTLMEPSAIRRDWQRETLESWNGCTRWITGWSELQTGVRGVILTNELLDAFPVTRYIWEASRERWLEAGVQCIDEGFGWARLESATTDRVAELLGHPLPLELLAVLPEGFALDLAAGAAEWWSEAARALTSGRLITFDYGLEASEFLTPKYASGTLRGYLKHRTARDELASPGAADLTAHVNFTTLRQAGVEAGLETEFMGSQRVFLTEVFARRPAMAMGSEADKASRLRQFHALTHPEHLGRAFRVLVQHRVTPGQ